MAKLDSIYYQHYDQLKKTYKDHIFGSLSDSIQYKKSEIQWSIVYFDDNVDFPGSSHI